MLRPGRLPGRVTIWFASRTWGNRGFSADPHYIRTCNRALLTTAPTNVLECGSGLTTIFAASLGEANGFSVYALEDHEPWRRRVQNVLSAAAVHLLPTPLTSFGDFEWYDISGVELPDFQVVICDGPRGQTRGGRYGLAPVMGSKISGATILLDDARRQGEQAVLARWADEHAAVVDLDLDCKKGLAIVRFPT